MKYIYTKTLGAYGPLVLHRIKKPSDTLYVMLEAKINIMRHPIDTIIHNYLSYILLIF